MISSMRTVRAMVAIRQSAARNFHHETVVSGPPMVKMSTAEMLVHMAFINVVFFGPPMWILANIKAYQARPEDGE